MFFLSRSLAAGHAPTKEIAPRFIVRPREISAAIRIIRLRAFSTCQISQKFKKTFQRAQRDAIIPRINRRRRRDEIKRRLNEE